MSASGDRVRRLVVCMGVCGCGKTTLAQALGARTGWPVLEGDDFHPSANSAKMAAGIALTNLDRQEWIRGIRQTVDARSEPNIVLACSALNPVVRNWLGEGISRELIWLWLDIEPDEAERRVAARSNHFMPAGLVQSQFDAFSAPSGALRLRAGQPVEQLVRLAMDHIQDGQAISPA